MNNPNNLQSKQTSRSQAVAWAALLVTVWSVPAMAEEKQNAAATVPATQMTSNDASRGFGVGAILGEPTGASLKYWVSERGAVDAAVAWSLRHDSSFHVHGDYLFHNFDLLPVPQGKLPVYFGVGGRVLFERHQDTRAGVRGPVGLAYLFEKVPVDIFVEVAPILDLAPSTRLVIEGGVGVRYFFH